MKLKFKLKLKLKSKLKKRGRDSKKDKEHNYCLLSSSILLLLLIVTIIIMYCCYYYYLLSCITITITITIASPPFPSSLLSPFPFLSPFPLPRALFCRTLCLGHERLAGGQQLVAVPAVLVHALGLGKQAYLFGCFGAALGGPKRPPPGAPKEANNIIGLWIDSIKRL